MMRWRDWTVVGAMLMSKREDRSRGQTQELALPGSTVYTM